MAFIYIQHLNPLHESMLSTILSKSTEMPVSEATQNMRIHPNHVIVIPPDKDMKILDGVLTLKPREKQSSVHLPINKFFISLAERLKENSIGIVLSGNASDGTIGLKAIKAAGGITFAQNETAKFQSMPKSAIAEGAVDLIFPPLEIAKELERIASNTSYRNGGSIQEKKIPAGESNSNLFSIFELLRLSSGVDFGNYKKTTLLRRVERRMLLHKLKTLKEYLHFLKQHTGEIKALFNDLLIHVTSFFRDPDLSQYLRKELFPKILKDKPKENPLRIWIPACSTGQEVYSIAIILMEMLGKKITSRPIQIFASDLSEAAIAKARLGVYSKSEVAEVSPDRLKHFFQKEDTNYRVVKSIRDLCVFAPHNIFSDPPFSRLDLISCCNLFIYLDPVLQYKALATFHYALNPNGFLVLGKTEYVATTSLLFSSINKKLKVYQRKKNGHARALFNISPPANNASGKNNFHPGEKKENGFDLEKTVDNILLSRFIPACVVVNEDLEVLRFRGSTGIFLEPSPGKASLNLLKMARQGLSFELRNIIHKAIKLEKPVRKSGIEIKNKSSLIHVSIEVVPLKSVDGAKQFLVLFEEEKSRDQQPSKGKTKDLRSTKLEQALFATREDMSAIIEERQAMNEELQSANEEVVSSNEELQSANEELQTSQEEIESTNEELQTINQELQVRNDLLSEAFNFADAVFITMREALVVLNDDLRILRANQRFYQLFHTAENETEKRLIYEVGNRLLDIPKLRELLEDIIPRNQEFNNFEVNHIFSGIGEKIMILNARRI